MPSTSGAGGVSEPSALRQQVEVCFAALKRVLGLGETLAKTLLGLATRIAAKITAYTYAFLVNRLLGVAEARTCELETAHQTSSSD